MTQSMTGFGRGEHSSDRYQFGIEIRSTNHRFLEIRLRFPRELSAAEGDVRKYIRSRFSRGYLDVQAFLGRSSANSQRFVVEGELLAQAAAGLREAGRKLGLEDRADLAVLSRFRELFRFEDEPDDPGELQAGILHAAESAVEDLSRGRRREGEEIARSVRAGVERFEGIFRDMEKMVPETNRRLTEALLARLDEIAGKQGLSPERLHQEAAVLAVKSDITEELERLRGHLTVFKETLDAEGPSGRKLDFLLQEMNRELNTTAAKTGALELSHLAIEGKLEMEKVREQIQNLE